MNTDRFMSTNRLEAFYDAIIAIIVTVLVLELPQPTDASLSAIWAIKNSYFAYLISFLICTNLWQYHHIIYNHVERINAKIIWQNILLLLIVSLIPYLTTFVANNPFSLLAQLLYGFDFILINILHYFMAKSLIEINPKRGLIEALNVKNSVVIPLVIFAVGLVGAVIGNPISISICCLITIIRSIFYTLK